MPDPTPALPTIDQRMALRQRPERTPVGHQRWNELLFLHWAMRAEEIQRTLPEGLFVDTFADQAYLGIVPFRMERIRPAYLPPLPWLSWFLELNLRTYVYDEAGRPGVWFYSLDCNQSLAVTLAQRFFHLPYFHAHMRSSKDGSLSHYECQREGSTEPSCYEWQCGTAAHQPTQPGTLEYFLIERYLLFSTNADGKLFTGRVHHQPYRVRTAQVSQCSTTPALQSGFALHGQPVSVLEARPVDVEVFRLEPAQQSHHPEGDSLR